MSITFQKLKKNKNYSWLKIFDQLFYFAGKLIYIGEKYLKNERRNDIYEKIFWTAINVDDDFVRLSSNDIFSTTKV